MASHPFGTINFAVLGLYLVGMLVLGLWCSRRVRTARSFFIADGRLGWLVVGLSLLGTYLSALTMMALSGIAFGEHHLTWAVQLPFLVLTAFVITRWVVGRYREAGIVSVYEYLEKRIHISARVLASLTFVVFSIGRTALVLYLPALAFSTVCNVGLTPTIIVMGAIITFYTVLGGIEAVVWTDAIQVCIFTFAAVYTLIAVFTGMGDADFVSVANQYGKLKFFLPGVSLFKITSLWLVLETIVQTIRIYGTQQDMVQRYMTADSDKSAKRSVWLGAVGYIPVCFMFYVIGVSLFVFYVVHPDPAVLTVSGTEVTRVMRADTVYPYFIATQLPPGLAGLLIAAVFAAAMSSIDSLMNSASTVCVEDFYRRFAKKPRNDRHYLLAARGLTVLWGVSATCIALLVFHRIEYAQKTWSVMQAVLGSGMLGLMGLAFLPFRVDKWAAGIAFAVSFVLVTWLKVQGDLIWLVLPIIGNGVAFFGALLLHGALGAARRAFHAP
jgi:SSS family solute:Na+ symporter